MNDQELQSLPAAKSAIAAPPDDKSLRVPCYCEENVWRLAYRKLHGQHQPDPQTTNNDCSYFVAFVSNPRKCVPMFEQLGARDRETPVFWDYHVILFMCQVEDSGTPSAFVLDIDSHLPYPCSLEKYMDVVFPNHTEWKDEYQPYFRVIDATVYLRNFSSDRSHMFNRETSTWNARPPQYDCILPSGVKDEISSNSNKDPCTITTLQRYMTISAEDISGPLLPVQENSEHDPFGRVYSLSQLLQRFRINN
mmetsp:Transcript_21153/g.58819  ORF Transcript_21153/g.58819 Transcript_21153/m.58819 type:complete len:250 (+) Transcript_21153:204-953(+)